VVGIIVTIIMSSSHSGAKKRRKEELREDVLEALEQNNVEGFESGDDFDANKEVGDQVEDVDVKQEESDSEAELQVAFQSGLLKPGLNVQLPQPDEIIYNHDSINELYSELKESNLEWLERMDVTSEPMDSADCIPNQDILKTVQSNELVNDDFKRELLFFRQAQASIAVALPQLRQLGVVTERPYDYFAEMAKSDQHMEKVREGLVAKEKTAQRIEKIRQVRDAKKFSKHIQIEKELAKSAEKKKVLENIEKVKRGESQDLSFLESGDSTQQRTKQQMKRTVRQRMHRRHERRKNREAKYGFGGPKRGMKRNDKKSSSAEAAFGPRTSLKKKLAGK